VNWNKLSGMGAVGWRPGRPETRLFLSLRGGSVRTAEVIDFLRNLRRHVRGSVVVLWDRLSAHRSGATQDYVASQNRWLKVEYFPAYAPELNPVEQMWANLDAQELANYSADDLVALGAQIERGKRRIRRRDLGLSFIKHAKLVSHREITQLGKAH
jgi:transposase